MRANFSTLNYVWVYITTSLSLLNAKTKARKTLVSASLPKWNLRVLAFRCLFFIITSLQHRTIYILGI